MIQIIPYSYAFIPYSSLCDDFRLIKFNIGSCMLSINPVNSTINSILNMINTNINTTPNGGDTYKIMLERLNKIKSID